MHPVACRSYNKLVALPENFGQLVALQAFALRLSRNPLEIPPLVVCESGIEEIASFFRGTSFPWSLPNSREPPYKRQRTSDRGTLREVLGVDEAIDLDPVDADAAGSPVMDATAAPGGAPPIGRKALPKKKGAPPESESESAPPGSIDAPHGKKFAV